MQGKTEKEKARQLRKSRWWQNKVQNCHCHYCHNPIPPSAVTMDHVIPIAQGGKSTKSNIVPCCKDCNTNKGHHSSIDLILASLHNRS